MSKPFDRPIIIQKMDEITEDWSDVYSVHARINKAKNNDEYLSAGAVQAKVSFVFEIRYFKELENIEFDTQLYRIVYDGHTFDIKDYDDYMLQHKTVKLLGVSY